MSKTADYADIVELGAKPERYDTQLWANRQVLYEDWWKYFSGDALEEEDAYATKKTDDKPVLFPLQMNLIQMVCMIHAGGLLGHTDNRDLPIDLVAKPRKDRGGKEAAKHASTVVSDYLETSAFEDSVDEAALCSMVFGGAFYKTAFDPGSEMGVRAEPVWPEWCRPVWYPNNYNRLAEIFVIRLCNEAAVEAAYHVKVAEENKWEGNKVRVVEHWTETSYDVKVAGKQARYSDGEPMKGEHEFGFVPYTYFPRYRMGGYYGESLIDGLTGIQDEINMRLADMGDAINATTHRIPWVRNRQQGSRGIDLAPGALINLGYNHQGPEPELGALDPTPVPPAGMALIEELFGVLRMLAHTPPVVYGIDEGSQRSALTLAFRMYPYTQMIHRYRRSWSYPLKQMAWQALKIMAIKGLNGVKEKHVNQLWSVGWAPIIPRDREQLVNETILMVQTMLRSPEKALELLADIPKEEIEEELARVKKYQEWRKTMQAPSADGTKPDEPVTKVDAPIATPMVE